MTKHRAATLNLSALKCTNDLQLAAYPCLRVQSKTEYVKRNGLVSIKIANGPALVCNRHSVTS